jgi:hypothetical protein
MQPIPEISEFDRACIELLDATPRKWSTNSFRSALNHLDLARKLFDIDHAMCAFRSLTAEEEAAAGLIRCLQDLGYEGAEKLMHKDHRHKAAVVATFELVHRYLSSKLAPLVPNFQLRIDKAEVIPRLTLAIPLQVNGMPKLAAPIPPLNFFVREGVDQTPPTFGAQIGEYCKTRGVPRISAALKLDANLRNKILYASPTGVPHIELKPEFYVQRRDRVLNILRAFLMIEPYSERQPFVQIVVNGLLAAMATALKEPIGQRQ